MQDDTFNGASLEKHRARFADRLGESSGDQATGVTTSVVSPDEEANVVESSDVQPSLVAEPSQPLDSIGSDISTPNDADVASQSETVEVAASHFYDSTFSLYPVGGEERQVEWVA